MQGIIERLKVSKVTEEKRLAKAGVTAGKRWASNVAKYRDLVRLAEFVANDGVDTYGIAQEDAYSNADHLAAWVKDHDDLDRDSAAYAFRGVDFKKFDDLTFLQGFCDGAMEVWDAVKDEI